MQISSQRRIGLASSLVIACIGVALAVTVWSYRNAVHARSVALGAVREETTAQTAETYLWRQREVMNEYLLTSSPGLLAEARAMERGFEREISQVGVGEPEETGLVTRAIRADKRFRDTAVWVTTTRGFVSLQGCVRSPAQKNALGRVVKPQAGVVLVWNEVTTKRPGK